MKLSAFLSTAFRHRFRAQLIKNRKTMITISVMQLAGICAVPAFALYLGSIFTDTAAPRIYESAYSSGKLLTVFSYIWAFSILSAAVTLVLAACEAVTQFRYLHGKPDTDRVLALPLTRTQLFAADWLSGLVTVAAPVILASSAAALIMLFSDAKRVITPDIAQSFIPQPVPVLSGYYDPLQTPDFYLPFYLYSVTDFSLLERFISAYIPAVIMIYTFTVSVSVCCGTVFESAVYTVLSGTALTLFPAALKTAFRESVPNSRYFWPFAESEVISPVGGVIRIICSVLPDAGVQMNGSTGTYRYWTVLHILFTLVYLTGACILFSNRKAENAEKPFAYPALFYAVSFAVTGSLVFNFASFSGRKFSDSDFAGYLTIPFAVSAVIFLVMLVIKDRGPAVRKPVRQILFFLCSFAVSALVSASFIITDGYGMMYHVPSPGNVESVTVINLTAGDHGHTVTDRDRIRAVTEAHAAINDEMKTWYKTPYVLTPNQPAGRNPDPEEMAEARDFDITYTLKSGAVVSYTVYALNTDCTGPLIFSEETDSSKAVTPDLTGIF